MKLLALPRDQNPYQELLYTAIEGRGHQVRYVGELTRSSTLNLLLLPAELAVRRRQGFQILHLHWVFVFRLTGSDRFPFLCRVAQLWFGVVLDAARRVGLRIVWTAHNVLPHEPVFADDVAARRRLLASCDLVLVHSPQVLAALTKLGLQPKRAVLVTHGRLTERTDIEALRQPGAGDPPRRLLYFGQVRPYKGVEDLLEAFRGVAAGAPVVLTVAGECRDGELAERLRDLADPLNGRVTLRLQRIPDNELSQLLADADAVVLPYRRVVTSGSALLALGHGRPLVVPAGRGLDHLPAQAVFPFDGTVADLTRAICDVAGSEPQRLRLAGRAAGQFAASQDWGEAATQTLSSLESLLPSEPH